ncbi:HAMP domain-containing sensor histidine kinase [Desulfosporosinus sp. OT]|uniref:sensor histidine kinase n=1 Tax=Desulfosporosinus sp. OT TaxID=913865 RepID=UPI000223A6CA|nr:HAMP domain-containing sensor histidine kinase [Desulfosporosinus sp. OT]EGW41905.1 HAMP domain protein [Desulfosporosinus sp. OT]
MDIKWKRYSYSLTAKLVAFVIAIVCITSAITIFINVVGLHNSDFGIAFEDSYFLGKDYMTDSSDVIQSLKAITEKYKSEENILNGGSINADVLESQEQELYYRDFEYSSKSYNPNLTTEENYKVFKEVYADKISKVKDQLIQEDLREYRESLQRLAEYKGLVYYAKSGTNEISKTPNKAKDYFKSFPSYMISDSSEQKVFPEEVKDNFHANDLNQLGPQDVMYVAFTDEFLNPRIATWNANKLLVRNYLYQMAGFTLALAVAFIYILLVIGRKPEEQQGVPLNSIDRIYNDIKIVIGIVLITIWLGTIIKLDRARIYELIFPITLLTATSVLTLVLSIVKHLKYRTLIKHSLVYSIFNKLFDFVKEIYNSGSVAVKVVLLALGYPVIVALTFFMFPITLGAAAWLALKKVKDLNAIKAGVKQVKEGDTHFTINVSGDGEFARLAADINSITEGLNKAVDNEIKSERLKSELITNVSHDIRTPLTSIITYVDLLKYEKDQTKASEYIEIIEQKSQRLKVLTEDLFEATKAASGNIPVNFETIDLVSLITQGLGEFDDKIQACALDFKISSREKEFIYADGKLLWRAIENLLLNIFKYALAGSRVYINIIDSGSVVILTIKNISAYELNISADELMERFKRGDESRSSQGSGLGLSIAKSLIEIQKGCFNIEIDGDLFKAIIQMNKAE